MIIINVFSLLVLNRFNLKPDTAYNWIDPKQFYQDQKWDLVSLHAKWDSFWYLDIVKNGYSFKSIKEPSNIVFFPLYPFLIKSLSYLTFGNLILSGWILSMIFLLAALIYFFKLIKEFHPEIDPYYAIILLLIFPTAFFLNSIYTESLFLFLSIATFYHALKRNFLLAGIFGFFASLSRVTGVLLFIPVLWEYFRNNNFKLNSIFKVKILPIFLIPLGIFSFFLFHYFKFKDFFLFFKAESWFDRVFFKLCKGHFDFFSNSSVANFSLDAFFVVFALIAVYFIFKKLPVSYGLYMIVSSAVIISTGTLMSFGRYILVFFPIYILGASIKNQYLKQAWIFVSILLLSLYTTLFVNNYWAG